jgi:hypothetical protein
VAPAETADPTTAVSWIGSSIADDGSRVLQSQTGDHRRRSRHRLGERLVEAQPTKEDPNAG